MGADRAVESLTGPARYNPLHYTGTITTFLVLVIILTGVYLTMFYQFGFEASYGAVATMESRWVNRIVRAAHRYASIAAVLMTLIHAWRTFVMDRFRGARWVPWISGIGMLLLLWIAGVTGYWMIWDVRAGPLNDALTNFMSSSRLGLDFLLDMVITETAGTGWAFILILFTIHLLVTGVIVGFYWYHIKRLTRRRFLPPREWVWVTLAALVAVSVSVPVGMLPAYDSSRLVEAIPFDPFFLFLLDPALDWPALATWGGASLILVVALLVPWLLRRRQPLLPIIIDTDRCTGCTLCVNDCPYRAITMEPRPEGRHRQVAVMRPNLCVGCGICIGSCPELAMTFGQIAAEKLPEYVQSRVERASREGPVEAVFACERHRLGAGTDGDWSIDRETPTQVVTLPCIGMVHPDLVGVARNAGAQAVRFVGCPPDECANLEGNTWLEDRINRDRLPRLSKDLVSFPMSHSWVTPRPGAVGSPNEAQTGGRRPWVTATIMMAIGLFVLVAASSWNYEPSNPETMIRISLDHRPGAPLEGFSSDQFMPQGPARLEVRLDGETVLNQRYPLVEADDGLASLAIETIGAEPGTHVLEVILHGEDGSTQLFDDTVALELGQVLGLDYRDKPPSQDAEEGRKIFTASSLGASAGCQICHSVEPDRVLVGPSLYGIADTASDRVPGLSAEEYLRQSILDPDAYIVEGFPSGQMLADFGVRLSEDEIENLVTYLLTLTEDD